MENNISFTVTYTNEIGGVETPLEAAKEALDGIINQGARIFVVKNNTTGETVSVDLDEDDEDAVLPEEPSARELVFMDMLELLRRVQNELTGFESDELNKFEKQLLRDANKLLKKAEKL